MGLVRDDDPGAASSTTPADAGNSLVDNYGEVLRRAADGLARGWAADPAKLAWARDNGGGPELLGLVAAKMLEVRSARLLFDAGKGRRAMSTEQTTALAEQAVNGAVRWYDEAADHEAWVGDADRALQQQAGGGA